MFDVQKIKEGLEVIGSDKAHLGTDVSEKVVLTVSADEARQQRAPAD